MAWQPIGIATGVKDICHRCVQKSRVKFSEGFMQLRTGPVILWSYIICISKATSLLLTRNILIKINNSIDMLNA